MNFMIMDINRNAMRRNPDKPIQSKMDQLTKLWGDESWKEAGYDTAEPFGEPEKVSNEEFAEAFRQRLEKKAGFKFVPKPMPMKTKTNSTIYYLYFRFPKAGGGAYSERHLRQVPKKQGL